MSARVQSFTLTNPNPSRRLFLKRASTALCRPPPSPASLRFETLQPHRVTVVARAVSLKGFVLGLLPLHRLSFKNRSVFSFAASHEESVSFFPLAAFFPSW
ncbi:hypothetical protein F0562_015111 [Nyssa sinensis]|uniref:Uncharacterized protein n=1 Tax=Nyssa sinensis TaxID=561372 RepID=A0A5J4ZK34_9ASTE|nr:hypothetical protein F0562_015111 [Nyssa sinensis]